MKDLNILGVLEMDAIGVRAVFGCRDRDVLHLHPFRVVEFQMAQRAVDDSQIKNLNVVALVESQGLKSRKF